MAEQWVFSVHSSRADEVGVIEVLYAEESDARRYAAQRSRDPAVLATTVCRYALGLLGTRAVVSVYRDGKPANGKDRRTTGFYPTDGPAD